MKKILVLIFAITSLLAKSLIFGVVPQQSPQKLYRVWSPFINYLSKEIGIKVIFKTEKSIPEFEKKLYSGYYDIAYSNPYHYTLVHKYQNHMALVRFNKKIVGILVARKDSNINSLNNIKNKEFLFPAPKAFAATILTKYEVLKKTGFDIEKSKKFRYVNSHDSVYLGIVRGVGDVGGGIIRTFNRFKNKNGLKIIYKTDPYPSHPISVRADLDKNLIEKIKQVLLNMPYDLVKKINKKRLIETNNAEYDVVKNLAVKLGIY